MTEGVCPACDGLFRLSAAMFLCNKGKSLTYYTYMNNKNACFHIVRTMFYQFVYNVKPMFLPDFSPYIS